MMDVFEALPEEKKERIINGAMGVFAAHGYHKASVADIAKAAGISKAMVFTYFGSKRQCYAYMSNEMLRISLEEFEKVREKVIALTDYFERMTQYLRVKIVILKQYPALLSFARSMYTERDPEVRPIINQLFTEADHLRDMLFTTDIDPEKFIDAADAQRVKKIVGWLSRGCTEEWAQGEHEAFDRVFADFEACLTALKKHFYKEAYR